MSNIKISQLTATTTNTIGSWVVINNSGETITNKSELEYVLGLTKGSGIDSIRSNDFLSTSATTSSGDSSIALGNGASATHDGGISIGKGSEALATQGISIGENSSAGHEADIAIGFGAITDTDGAGQGDAIAIGRDAKARRNYGIAIGYDAFALDDGIAIGRSTRPIGNTCTAIGKENIAAGNAGYAIGANIFSDRTNAGGIGSSVYVSGQNSIGVGANLNIGASGGDCEDSVNIGSDNDIAGGAHKQISIGYQSNTSATGAINLSSQGLEVNSPYGINIGGSGNTYSGAILFGPGNIRIGGFDDTINQTPGSYNTFIGGKNNTYNTAGGSGQNNVYLGLSGRSQAINSTNTTFVENLNVYGTITQGFTTYSATTVVIDVSKVGYANILALNSGSTYDIQVSPAPNNIGDTVTLFVEYQDGATITFNNAGSVQWRWDRDTYGGAAPVFSATTGGTSRSIIVLNTWDGNDMFEVSRSMNMY